MASAIITFLIRRIVAGTASYRDVVNKYPSEKEYIDKKLVELGAENKIENMDDEED